MEKILKICFQFLMCMATLVHAQGYKTTPSFELYGESLHATFTPYFDRTQVRGPNAYCSLNFHVNEDGGIKSIEAEQCDLSGKWEQSILKTALQIKEKQKLPPPYEWEKIGVQQVLFFRDENRGTTAKPPLLKIVKSVVPLNIQPIKPSASFFAGPVEQKLVSQYNPVDGKHGSRSQEDTEVEKYIAASLQASTILLAADENIEELPNCSPINHLVKLENYNTFIERSNRINYEIASSVEIYTSGKISHTEAVDFYNFAAKKSNELKQWGETNKVLGICAQRGQLEKINKIIKIKEKLISLYGNILSQRYSVRN